MGSVYGLLNGNGVPTIKLPIRHHPLVRDFPKGNLITPTSTKIIPWLALLTGTNHMDIWDVDVLLLSAGYAPLRRRGDTAPASA